MAAGIWTTPFRSAWSRSPLLTVRPATVTGVAKDFYRYLAVRDDDAGGKVLQAEGAHFVDVAHGAVGDYAHKFEALEQRAHDLAKERRRYIRRGVMGHHDARRGHFSGVFQGVHPLLAHGRIVRLTILERNGKGVAHDFTKFRIEAADRAIHVSRATVACVELFDGICNGWAVDGAQGGQLRRS